MAANVVQITFWINQNTPFLNKKNLQFSGEGTHPIPPTFVFPTLYIFLRPENGGVHKFSGNFNSISLLLYGSYLTVHW